MKRSSGWAARIFLLACTLYANSLGHGFHYDDFHSVVYNPHIRNLDQVPRFFYAPASFSIDPKQAMYRPLLLVSYALNYAWGGYQPAGYHLVNAALHGVNAVLVLLLLLGLGRDRRLALIGAVLFAVHPLNSEAVHYVSSRSELLMANFALAACLAWVRFGRTGRRRWGAAALVAQVLALLTKSVAVVLPGTLALCDLLARGRGLVKSRWRWYLGFVGVDLLYVLFVRQLIGKALLEPVRSLEVQVWTQLKAAVYYLLLGVMPVKLSVEHQFFVARHLGEAAVVGAGLVLVSLLFLLIYGREKLLRFAWAWAVLLLAPTSAVPLIVLVNEHRLYLAGLGLSLVLAWALKRLLDRRRGVALWGGGVYTILLAWIAFQRGQVWTDELTLWQDAVAKGPLMLKPHLRLGDALVRQGRQTEAEDAYLRAVSLRPQHPGARNNLGRLYLRQGRLQEAEGQFREVLQTSPDVVPARLNLASLRLRGGDWREAAAEYRRVLEFDDTGGVAQKNLGHIALKFQGKPGLALAYYDQAVDLTAAGDKSVWSGRGVALKALRRVPEAEASFLKALGLDPAYGEAWFNLGNLYRDTGRIPAAVRAYGKVVEIGGDSTLSTLAEEQLQSLKPKR